MASLIALMIPAAMLGQKKEIQDLQRDFGLLQMDVRTLQRSFDEKIAALTVLLQQTLDSSNKANTALALLEREVRERLREQEKTVVAPVAGLGSKVDAMADEFRFVKESVTEMNARLNRLQTQMTELDTAIKTINAPLPPPPGSGQAANPGGAPAGISPLALFDNAVRDKMAGKSDLALQQFNDYIKWFGATEQACEAQYFAGEIYAARSELEAAIQAFDAVLEKYPSTCVKKADAQYMKAKTLAKAGQRTAAVTELREMLKRYPTGEWASKANTELKLLGFRTTPETPARRRK